jgi:outer membrane protein assembly factor BamB
MVTGVQTCALPISNGRLALFAADQSGRVTAVDVEAGTILWQTTKTNESFVAGVSGITRAFGHPSFQAAYSMDVLLLGSATSGNVLMVNALTGATLWTVSAGAQVRALVTYDSNTNRFYVPTTAGVAAFDLTGSSPSTRAAALAGWTNPGGNYSLYCARTWDVGTIACIDRSGVMRLLDAATGAVRTTYASGLTAPSTLIRFSGTSPGFVIGSSSQIQRLAAAASPYTLTRLGAWSASGSATISSALVLSVSGYVIVASSDGSLHRLRLSDATWLAQSPAVPAVVSGRLLGPVSYDTTHGLLVFGTSEGRVWAIPMF